MSDTHGRTPGTSAHSTPAVTNGGPSGSPGGYVSTLEHTAPFEAVDRADARGQSLTQGGGSARPSHLDDNVKLREEVEAARERVDLQNDRALRQARWGKDLNKAIDQDREVQDAIAEAKRKAELEVELKRIERQKTIELERIAEQAKVEKERTKHQLASDKAEIRRAGRKLRFDNRMADLTLRLDLWKARAKAKWERLTDPASKMATLYRLQWIVMGALGLLALGGIAWTAAGVKTALVGDANEPLAYLVEPLASVPFLVLMSLHAVAAMFGRNFPAKGNTGQQVLVYGMEIGLGLAMLITNISPVVPLLGEWKDTSTFLSRFLPPLLIVAAVVLMNVANRFFSGLLVELFPDEVDGGRLGEDTAKLLDHVVAVENAMRAGELAASADNKAGEVAPSASRIASFRNIRKSDAGLVRDAINRLAQRA